VIVHCDASNDFGGGIIISQIDPVSGMLAPLLYSSFAWAPNERAWSPNIKEAAVLHKALSQVVPNAVPWASRIVVLGDHKNYMGVGMATSVSPLVRKWWAQIQGLSLPYVAVHVPGPLNPADFPSRAPAPAAIGEGVLQQLPMVPSWPSPPSLTLEELAPPSGEPPLRPKQGEQSSPPSAPHAGAQTATSASSAPVVAILQEGEGLDADARRAAKAARAARQLQDYNGAGAYYKTPAQPAPSQPEVPCASERERAPTQQRPSEREEQRQREREEAPQPQWPLERERAPLQQRPSQPQELTLQPPPSPQPPTPPVGDAAADDHPLASPIVRGHLITAPLIAEIAAAQADASEEERASWGEDSHRLETVDINGLSVVMRDGRIVVPTSALQQRVLEMHHAPHGLHLGHRQVIDSAKRSSWWATLEADAEALTHGCPQCQYGNIATGTGKVGTLYPSTPWAPLASLYVDYVGPFVGSCPDFVETAPHSFILVGVDAFTRVVLLRSYERADGHSSCNFLEAWAARYGMPHTIRSDRGSHFNNRPFRALCKENNIDYIPGVSYHHRGQGVVERLIKEVTRMLVKSTYPAFDKWATGDRMERMTRVINETPHGVLGMSPFEAAHGVAPRSTARAALGLPAEVFESIAAFHRRLLRVQELVLFNSAFGQLCNKRDHDRTHRPAGKFQRGAYVMVRSERKPHKLAPAGEGPFIVDHEEPGDMYVIHRLLADRDVRTVHVSRLTPFEMALTSEHAEALRTYNGGVEGEDSEWALVSAVLKDRARPDGRYEFLVRWVGHEKPSWVHGYNLRRITAFREYVTSTAGRLSFAAATQR